VARRGDTGSTDDPNSPKPGPSGPDAERRILTRFMRNRDPYPHGINLRIERVNPATGKVERFVRNYWTGD